MIPLLLFALAATAPGAGDASPSLSACQIPDNARAVLDLHDLPPAIRTDLNTRLPNLAPRDAAFQRSDVVREPGLPTRRFIGAVSAPGSWIILYEHGVIDHIHAVKYAAYPTRSAQDATYSLVPHGNLTGPLCAILQASLSNVSAADPGHL
ncbi:hypothetical protein AWL63_18430 [Sphingomonas panacis]|uniref:Uncharacterized protein n=1 Tax=Sphingomonas panacis TaxID=1560345 RepID=A0A1B3ZDW8_9SPHN|nr:hypothetical protein [Sphingomonas panacis]AOH85619.1 hypothetical protein AWL63_18430 [Sphingomonas panacis]